ncbi:hypothetical protein CONCODRAFT_12627 [Conidiobolus coronatus NRRL 28638]|uniref:F-box domain-containing protein n=1 Tax=Conidiobolus coronatus (strain ATCC 28846 / CBS 209.66 / NRRL 28638) TaxID=796925 RepID=A0A137NSL8_CONC2|nr:hypothetical protein CONCODRAFT_12627 [Conidiobolus coronatus NRRL 28638]|eukprot:KXN65711.1 hypothetical protein CONCODRAFT_12627 [Conidiobolus coronatus NRRL 28638]
MDIKIYKEDHTDSWEYLPDTFTLFQYLERKDLIELSKCSKSYRNQLERKVLEELSLITWRNNNWKIYYELTKSWKYGKVLEIVITSLGNKLKLAKKLTLDCHTSYLFKDIFAKLMPNIKSLILYGSEEFNCCLGQGLISNLKGMENLEHLNIRYIWDTITDNSTINQIFPKSLKTLKITYGCDFSNNDDKFTIYDTIDSTYINLYSLSIVSNRMLQNLACGVPNLQEVEIKDILNLDNSKLVDFLKSNPQIRRINTKHISYSDESLKILLYSNYLEHWNFLGGNWKEIKFDNLPSNYSIKYLKINSSMPSLLALQLIKACKGLKTLDLTYYHSLNNLDWSKFEQNINILKISCTSLDFNNIKEIDNSMIFNIVYVYARASIKMYDINKLKNYKFTPSISNSFTLKLINK